MTARRTSRGPDGVERPRDGPVAARKTGPNPRHAPPPDPMAEVWARLLRDGAATATIAAADGPRPATAPDLDRCETSFMRVYAPLCDRAPRWIAQLGQTLDGRVATLSGHSFPVTGPEDHRHLHRLRALHDAVVVGVETVVLDDPALTVRHVAGPHPTRVILDPRGRAPLARRVFQDGVAPTLWVRATPPEDTTLAPHVRVLTLPAADVADDRTARSEASCSRGPSFAAAALRAALAAQGLERVLVEGGARTVSGFVAAGIIDRLYLCVAPIVLGSGRPGLTLPPVETMQQALRPRVERYRLGDDLLHVLDLRRGV